MSQRRPAGRMILSVLIPLSLGLLDSGSTLAAQNAANAKAVAVNACALLSAEEISAIVRFKVDDGIRDDTGEIHDGPYDGSHSTTCLWKAADDQDANDPSRPLGGARFVILNVMSWPAGSPRANQFLQGFRDAAEDHTISGKPVPLDIGDESLWWGDGVAVRKGHISYGVSVHSVNERAQERQMGETLAATILKRI